MVGYKPSNPPISFILFGNKIKLIIKEILLWIINGKQMSILDTTWTKYILYRKEAVVEGSDRHTFLSGDYAIFSRITK